MSAMLATVFAASLVGSPHCAAMCGGLVAFSAGSGASPLAHHLGRGLVYGALGAAAGALGRGADAIEPRAAAVIAAALMIAWSVAALLEAWGVARTHLLVPRPLQRLAFRATAAARRLPPGARGLALGAASALIPCGWLYAFVIAAGGTGGALAGAAAMLVFWAGTLPMLASVGVLAQRLAAAGRVHLPRWAPVVVLVVGLASLVVRWPGATGPRPASLDPASSSVLVPQEVSCHGGGR